jgi:catechol 2,3-dioxygenase-like lactoylglutathione lyase family enzyme
MADSAHSPQIRRAPLDSHKPVPPGALSHIVLRSRDVQKAKKWYQTVLMARNIMGEESPGAGLSFDAEHHRVLILPLDPRNTKELENDDLFAVYDKTRKLPGLEHVAFKYHNLGDLLSTYKRLAREGIEPAFCVNHGGTLSMYYLDPDGNNVELLMDTMTMDMSLEWMNFGSFRENSVGYPWDPADYCKRYEAGEPLKSMFSEGWRDLG